VFFDVVAWTVESRLGLAAESWLDLAVGSFAIDASPLDFFSEAIVAEGLALLSSILVVLVALEFVGLFRLANGDVAFWIGDRLSNSVSAAFLAIRLRPFRFNWSLTLSSVYFNALCSLQAALSGFCGGEACDDDAKQGKLHLVPLA